MHPNEPILKLPPHSIEAEQSLIGGLLIDNSAIDQVANVKPGHFYRGAHQKVFRCITNLIREGQIADIVSVSDALKGDDDECCRINYLIDVANSTPSSANIGQYARIIIEHALERQLLLASNEIAAIAHDVTRRASDKLNSAQSLIMSLSENASLREPRLIRDVMVDVIDEMQRIQSGKDVGIKTGLVDLDRALSGGLHQGDMIILAGRPSMGKTSLGVQIAQNCATNGHVALVMSMEMTAAQIGARMVSSFSRVPLDTVLHGNLMEEDADRVEHAISLLSDVRIVIDDQPALTVMDVLSKARSCRRRHGLDLVVIDYLQLMQGEGDNRNAELEIISRGLKSMARELNVPVIALSQLSRKCEDRTNKRPVMSDLRDSGALEQDADVVMFIYRDEVYNEESSDRGTAEILIRKNRQGPVGMVRLTYQGHLTRFDNCDYHQSRNTVVEIKPKMKRRYGEDA